MLDRDATARALRRRELEEALADEVERERMLREQVDAVVLAAETPRIDASLRAALDAKDVELIDDLLADDDDTEDDAWLEELSIALDPTEGAHDESGVDDELARLHSEIARASARREALVRAIALLASPLPAPTAEREAG